jgi:hypothetical protein
MRRAPERKSGSKLHLNIERDRIRASFWQVAISALRCLRLAQSRNYGLTEDRWKIIKFHQKGLPVPALTLFGCSVRSRCMD